MRVSRHQAVGLVVAVLFAALLLVAGIATMRDGALPAVTPVVPHPAPTASTPPASRQVPRAPRPVDAENIPLHTDSSQPEVTPEPSAPPPGQEESSGDPSATDSDQRSLHTTLEYFFWSDDAPDELIGDQLRDDIGEITADCAPTLPILGVDCGVPPCFVMFEGSSSDWQSMLTECDWSRHYRRKPFSLKWTSSCPDGTTRSYIAVAPKDALDHVLDGTGQRAMMQAVAGSRTQLLKAGWSCPAE